MTILVFGKTGQVATELQRRADVIALGRDQADLSDPEACAAAIHEHKPTVVINAAAYTAVDKAETDDDVALAVNGLAPKSMAEACNDLGIPLVHISTDYVFNGSGTRPWTPDDTPEPLGAYGRTKRAGEDYIQAADGVYAILRTSWVFSAHGNNFVKTMLRLGADRDTLSIVADQIGGPTSAADIAEACLSIADQLITDPERRGLYHFAGAPNVSWADFAREIFRQAQLTVDVTDIPSSEFPTPAQRPENSRMDCSTLNNFGMSNPQWEQSLTLVLKELGAVK